MTGIEELQQKIVQLENQLNDLRTFAYKGKYSNMTVYNGDVQINGNVNNRTQTVINADGEFLINGLLSGGEIAIQGWSSTLVFSAPEYRVVAWAAGTIKLVDGTTFSIDAGNTGNMAAVTYIYFDKGVSETVLQVSTTYSDAVGSN